jgi:hypothetical protein
LGNGLYPHLWVSWQPKEEKVTINEAIWLGLESNELLIDLRPSRAFIGSRCPPRTTKPFPSTSILFFLVQVRLVG